MRRYQLSLPGPSEVDPRVLQELARPNLPHAVELWVGIYRGLIEKLRAVHRTSGRVFVLPCSGSGAVDAALGSLKE
jgi:aspartate aminotransferase-like enzyme